MGDVADGGLCPGGSDVGCVLFWSRRGSGPIRNPLGIEGFSDVSHSIVFNMVALVLVVAAAWSVFMRLRGAKGVERQQIKWFAYAAAATVMGLVLAYIIPDVIDVPLWFERIGHAIFLSLIPAIPISIGIAVLKLPALRHRPHHQPHPRLRLAYRHAGRTLLRGYRGVCRGVFVVPHRPEHIHPSRLWPPPLRSRPFLIR